MKTKRTGERRHFESISVVTYLGGGSCADVAEVMTGFTQIISSDLQRRVGQGGAQQE